MESPSSPSVLSGDYWQRKLAELMIYAANNPLQFLFNVLIILSPFFAISAFLSWKLMRAIDKEQKENKFKVKRGVNIAKIRRGTKKDS
uniref:Small integral membrane protein 15 n=1 Tax=Romanomermis culicivorax TaxID=13658 RepID=A0A915HL32_ROMCU